MATNLARERGKRIKFLEDALKEAERKRSHFEGKCITEKSLREAAESDIKAAVEEADRLRTELMTVTSKYNEQCGYLRALEDQRPTEMVTVPVDKVRHLERVTRSHDFEGFYERSDRYGESKALAPWWNRR